MPSPDSESQSSRASITFRICAHLEHIYFNLTCASFAACLWWMQLVHMPRGNPSITWYFVSATVRPQNEYPPTPGRLDGWTRSGHYSARDHVRDTTLVISRCCLFNFKLNNDHSTGILSAMVCSVERGKGKGLGVLRVHLHLHLHLSARHTPSNSRVRLACS